LQNLSHNLISEIIIIAQNDSKELMIAKTYKSLPITFIKTKEVPSLYEAWNMGIEKSKNNLLVNSNSDDLYIPGGLEILHTGSQNYDLFGGSYYLEKLSTREKINALNCFKDKWIPSMFWIWHKSLGLFSTKYQISGDFDFFTRNLLQNKRMGATSKTVGIAYYNGMSVINKRLARNEDREIKRVYYGR
jgi:hypothetical protein